MKILVMAHTSDCRMRSRLEATLNGMIRQPNLQSWTLVNFDEFETGFPPSADDIVIAMLSPAFLANKALNSVLWRLIERKVQENFQLHYIIAERCQVPTLLKSYTSLAFSDPREEGLVMAEASDLDALLLKVGRGLARVLDPSSRGR